jgi:predicted RNA-binding protein with PIN domain
MIVRGAGCYLLSARELKAEIDEASERIRQEYREIQGRSRESNSLKNSLSPEVKQQLEELIKKGDLT